MLEDAERCLIDTLCLVLTSSEQNEAWGIEEQEWDLYWSWEGLDSADKIIPFFLFSFCSFQPSLKGKGVSEDPLNLR
jgi:hypothetical protein